MKKRLFPVLFCMSLCLLFGCAQSQDSQSNAKNPEKAALADEELPACYLETLEAWAEQQALMEIDHVSIDEFTVDTLLMDGYRNQKSYQNISMEVGVSFDRTKMGGGAGDTPEYTVTGQVYDQVRAALKQNSYGFRISNLIVNCIDLEGNIRSTDGDAPSDNRREINSSSGYAAPQTAEEMYVQTIAYDFTTAFNKEYFSDTSHYFPYGEICLRRFGITPGSDSLYIEIAVYVVGGTDDPERADFKASLDERSEELFNAITKDEKAMQYLKDNDAASVTVAFYTPWEKQGDFFYTYSYNL